MEDSAIVKRMNEFGALLKGYNVQSVSDLNYLLPHLSELKLREGYDLRSFTVRCKHNKYVRAYACRKDAQVAYRPTIHLELDAEYVAKAFSFRKLLFHHIDFSHPYKKLADDQDEMNKELVREISRDIHVKYKDIWYVDRCLEYCEARDIPRILDYLDVNFTPDGVLEAWMLNNLEYVIPDQNSYDEPTIIIDDEIFHKLFFDEDIKIDFKDSTYDHYHLLQQKLFSHIRRLDVNDLLPTLEVMDEDHMKFSMTYYLEEDLELVRYSVIARRNGNGIVFEPEERKRIAG